MSDSDFLHILKTRGFVYQLTDEAALGEALRSDKNFSGYIGFDATADSLHVGSLVQIMMLRRLQTAGHKPIVLMGGGTSMVGDPSGKDSQRQMLTPQDIQTNIQGIGKIFARYLEFGAGAGDALMLNNDQWLTGLGYIELLRQVGTQFSVNRMLGFDSVKRRLDREQNLSFLEFNYMILQAYDFMTLAKDYGCRLQMGGSDQWGNIISGIELARRLHNIEVFGLTSPLLTTASGAKMGKTATGAVWLNADKCPPYEFWQYWRNSEDADVGRFLRLFTELPLDEIEKLERLQDSEINEAKIILANEVTALCHGADAAASAHQAAQKLFGEGALDDNMPQFNITSDTLAQELKLYQLLAQSGLAVSNSEARRDIKGGGVYINDVKITDENFIITDNLFTDNVLKLSKGKKQHIKIILG